MKVITAAIVVITLFDSSFGLELKCFKCKNEPPNPRSMLRMTAFEDPEFLIDMNSNLLKRIRQPSNVRRSQRGTVNPLQTMIDALNTGSLSACPDLSLSEPPATELGTIDDTQGECVEILDLKDNIVYRGPLETGKILPACASDGNCEACKTALCNKKLSPKAGASTTASTTTSSTAATTASTSTAATTASTTTSITASKTASTTSSTSSTTSTTESTTSSITASKPTKQPVVPKPEGTIMCVTCISEKPSSRVRRMLAPSEEPNFDFINYKLFSRNLRSGSSIESKDDVKSRLKDETQHKKCNDQSKKLVPDNINNATETKFVLSASHSCIEIKEDGTVYRGTVDRGHDYDWCNDKDTCNICNDDHCNLTIESLAFKLHGFSSYQLVLIGAAYILWHWNN